MTETQRHTALLALLSEKRVLSVSNVIDEFDISPATARRDLNKLEGLGKLRKIRNGAEATENQRIHWSPMGDSPVNNRDEKTRIAAYAANLVSTGESALINCGSTAFLLGKEICGRNIQVITNYFPLMSYLIENGHDNVVIIGGQYHQGRGIILPPLQHTTPFYADYMFTSGKGLTESGLYKMDILSAMAEQKMLSRANKLVALVDSSKLGLRAGMLFSAAEQINVVITGKEANESIVISLKNKGIDVRQV